MSTRFHPVLYLALVSVDNTDPPNEADACIMRRGCKLTAWPPREVRAPTPIVLEIVISPNLSLKIPFQWTLLFLISKETIAFSSFRHFSSFDIFQKFRCVCEILKS